MSRRKRAFRPEHSQLEGRMLLSRVPAAIRLAPSDPLAPSVESVHATPEGIAVKFTKPMDPAGASNAKNYSVKAISNNFRGSGAPSLGDFFGIHSSTPAPQPVKIQAARYDAATQTATLIIKGKMHFRAWSYNLSPGHPARVRGERIRLARLGPALTDLEGRPLDRGHDVLGRYSLGVNPPGSPPAPADPQTPLAAPPQAISPVNLPAGRLDRPTSRLRA